MGFEDLWGLAWQGRIDKVSEKEVWKDDRKLENAKSAGGIVLGTDENIG